MHDLECTVHDFADSSQQTFGRNEIVQRRHHEYALLQHIRAAHYFSPTFGSTFCCCIDEFKKSDEIRRVFNTLLVANPVDKTGDRLDHRLRLVEMR